MLWVRGLVFTVLVPAMVGFVIPWAIAPRARRAGGIWDAGWLLVGAGTLMYGLCLIRFLSAGGTPAIFFTRRLRFLIGAEPAGLVSNGLYKFSRNPMYLGVLLVVFGQAMAFASPRLAVYGGVVFLLFHLTVVFIEEPHLRATRGAFYEAYCGTVPRWLGRARQSYTRIERGNTLDWTRLLKDEVELTYATTLKLLDKVDANSLDWKPNSGSNWMTSGQLLQHITCACGAACKGFVTGDWGMPEGMKIEDLSPEDMLPPAEKMPAIGSVAETKKLLMEDRTVALQMIDQAGERDLANKRMAAPWAPGMEYPLGWHLLQMVQHLDRHKAQLFYYLKLQGKPVNTMDLWG